MNITRKPTHPGEIIKEDYLMPLQITNNKFATMIGVSRKTILLSLFQLLHFIYCFHIYLFIMEYTK